MNDANNQYEFLDILAIIGFVVGLANYNENVNQTEIQKIVNQAITDIHEHLKMQDDKIDKILEVMNNENN